MPSSTLVEVVVEVKVGVEVEVTVEVGVWVSISREFLVVSWAFEKISKGISVKFQRFFKGVSKKFQYHSKKVFMVLQGSSRVFQWNIMWISKVQRVFKVFDDCFTEVFRML